MRRRPSRPDARRAAGPLVAPGLPAGPSKPPGTRAPMREAGTLAATSRSPGTGTSTLPFSCFV
ncbi:hypothetical protein C7S15_3949 [Burkholderia cepacia]|nr:hypothetical protein [Burkholderia cepacia]